MPISPTASFTLNRDAAIAFALHRLNMFDITVTPDATTTQFCSDTLNQLLKHLQTKGIKLWTVSELNVPLAAGKNMYTFGPALTDVITNKPLKLVQAFLRNNTVSPVVDIPLRIISQEDYNRLGSKNSSGIVNSVYMEMLRDTTTLHTFLTPDIFTATNYSIHVVVQLPVADVLLSTDNFDFPNEWMYAVGWKLAAELAVPFGLPQEKVSVVEAKAAQALDEIEGWDREWTSVYFTPDNRYGVR